MKLKSILTALGWIWIVVFGVLWGFIEASEHFGVEPLKKSEPQGLVILISLSFNIAIVIICLTYGILAKLRGIQYKSRGYYAGQKLSKTLVDLFKQMAKFEDYQTILRMGVPLSRALWLEGLYEARVEIGKIVEEAALKLGKFEAQVQALIDDIGWTFVAIGKLDKAEKHILRGIDVASNNSLDYYAAKGYRHLGGIEIQKGQPTKALSWLEMAEEAAKGISDNQSKKEMLAGIRCGQVEACLRLDKLDDASLAISEYEKLFLECGDKPRAVKAYAQRGKVCERQEKYLEAKDHYRKGLKVAKDLDRKDEIIRNHLGLARIAVVEKESEEAKKHIKIAKDMQSHIPLVFEDCDIENKIHKLEKE